MLSLCSGEPEAGQPSEDGEDNDDLAQDAAAAGQVSCSGFAVRSHAGTADVQVWENDAAHAVVLHFVTQLSLFMLLQTACSCSCKMSQNKF